jgi:hypothetical protein
VLDKAVKGIAPARLPQSNSLSTLAKDQQFTSVGYGAQSVTNGPGGKTYHYADIRYVSTGKRTELPGSRRGRDQHRRGHHDRRGHDLPLDERRLPTRHALGARIPRRVRHVALDVQYASSSTRRSSLMPKWWAISCSTTRLTSVRSASGLRP